MIVRDPSDEGAGERIANFRVYIKEKIRSSAGAPAPSFPAEADAGPVKV
jgi:hypothetical protein